MQNNVPLPSYAEFYAKFFEIQVLLLVLVPGRNGKQSTTHTPHTMNLIFNENCR